MWDRIGPWTEIELRWRWRYFGEGEKHVVGIHHRDLRLPLTFETFARFKRGSSALRI